MTVSELIRYYSDKYGIDPSLPLNVACAESEMSPTATNPKSTAGGPFQFLDGTWDTYCKGDKMNPRHNVMCGVRMISEGRISHWNESKYHGFGGGWTNSPYSKGKCK